MNTEKNFISEDFVMDRVVFVIKELQKKYDEVSKDSDFANKIDYPKQTFSAYKNKTRKVNVKLLCSIKKAFPELNMEYVFIGEGNWYVGDNEEVQNLKEKNEKLQSKVDAYIDLIKEMTNSEK